jgi:uncharacterized protein YgiM (DUF1202 family)
MDSRSKLHFSFVAFAVLSFSFCCLADQEAAQVQPAAQGDPNAASPQALPYYAKIIADNVYVRSGPGTNYYRCSKLAQGDIVKIVSATNVWSRILPPKGCFSWISKQYVDIDKTNPDMGTVTGDEVRVYAGSQYYEPIHSDRIQVHLNRGDKVTLMGEEMGDYYKIVPPEGAFFWVSTQYAEPTDVTSLPAPTESAPAPELKPETKPEPEAATPTVVPTTTPAESERLQKYYNIQEQTKAELTKPLSEQNYAPMKEALNALISADDSDKAARYAKFALGQIDRYELAAKVDKENKLQNAELDKIREKIDEVHEQRLAGFQDLGKYAVIGKLETSNVYGPEEVLLHYIVVDARGKIICYALPTGAAEHMDIKEFIGQKVGLVGKIEPHPQTAGALVKFTEIERLK